MESERSDAFNCSTTKRRPPHPALRFGSQSRQHNFWKKERFRIFQVFSAVFCAKNARLCFFHREKLYIGTDVSFSSRRSLTRPEKNQTAAEKFYWKHQTWPNRLVILTITWDERILNDFCFPFFSMTQIKSPGNATAALQLFLWSISREMIIPNCLW